MARYRGRHRKPTHTGRNLVAISTSGAFLAVGLTTASNEEAHAAPDSVWDKLAQCESSGNWSINTGNPFSGGLQFLPSTWDAFRTNVPGTPSEAHHATREQQIAVAEYVLDAQGWGAWPACADKLGLWGHPAEPGNRSAAPAATPQQETPQPRPQSSPAADPANLGQRAADGSGQYRCADDMLHFEACDPHNLGEIVAFPLYTHAATAQPTTPAPAQVSTGKHAKPDVAPATAGKPAETEQTAAPAGGNSVTDAAKALLGTPYVWGGTTSSGVDCSGLVYNALQAAGHSPPRTAAALQDWAQPISQSEAQAGDLFFWNPGGGGSTATHTGIYLGDNTVIEVSQPGTVVSIRGTYSGMTFGRIP